MRTNLAVTFVSLMLVTPIQPAFRFEQAFVSKKTGKMVATYAVDQEIIRVITKDAPSDLQLCIDGLCQPPRVWLKAVKDSVSR